MSKERSSELKDMSIETSQTEKHKGKKKKTGTSRNVEHTQG